MASRLLPILAWLLLAAIAFSTLAPIGLRPTSSFSANYERLFSFGLVGFLFAIAYPRKLLLITGLVFGAAVSFEILQMLVASRHAQLSDMGIKLLGGGLGLFAGAVTSWLWSRFVLRRA